MASIRDQKIDHFLHNMHTYRNDRHRSAWIGARRKKYKITRRTRRNKRLFVWADNSPVSFDDWRRGEPNGDHEGCTVVWYKNNYAQGVWNDIPCHAKVRSLINNDNTQYNTFASSG